MPKKEEIKEDPIDKYLNINPKRYLKRSILITLDTNTTRIAIAGIQTV